MKKTTSHSFTRQIVRSLAIDAIVLIPLLVFACHLSAPGGASGATQKISGLTPDTAPSPDDVVATVKGDGSAKKVTARDLVAGGLGTAASRGNAKDVYFSNREVSNGGDGLAGIGTKADPYNGGTAAKLDAVLADATKAPASAHIHLIGPGPFQTTIAPANLWQPRTSWVIEGEGMYATTLQAAPANLAGIHQDLQLIKSSSSAVTDYVTVKNLTLDCNWQAFADSADSGAGGFSFTDGVTTSGSPVVKSASRSFSEADYTRTISGAGIPASSKIQGIPTTTIAVSSDGAALPQATINVVSTTSFASAGTFAIEQKNGTLQTITYTGKGATTFTGCTGGTGSIYTANRAFAKHQAILFAPGGGPANATATATGVTVAVGGEKYAKIDGMMLWGGNNTAENVRVINSYGSFANASESFNIFLNAASTGSENNAIKACRAELPQGNYHNAFVMSNFDDYRLLTNSRIIGNTAKGRNTGDANFGFTVAGSQASGKGIEISGNTFIDCGSAYYIDTSAITDLKLVNNSTVRAQYGARFTSAAPSPAPGSNTWKKTNVVFSNNTIGLQNRENYPSTALITIFDDTVNLQTHENTITFDSTGESTSVAPQFVPFVLSSTTSGSVTNNRIDDNGGPVSQYYSTASAVRLLHNRLFSGKDMLWTRPDVGGGAQIIYDGPARFGARLNALQSVADSTFTKGNFDTLDFVGGGLDYDTTNKRFTAKIAGLYQFNLAILMDGLTSGNRVIASLYKNGTEFRRLIDTSTGGSSAGGGASVIVEAAANDYFELFVWHNHGSAANVEGGIFTTFTGGRL